MYKSLERNNFKIDLNNHKFFIEKLKNFDFIDFNDYSKWNILRDKIIKI